MATDTSETPPFRYTAALAGRIETAWQERWDRERTFAAPNPGQPGFDPSRPKFYCLDMFPYPSGEGLHVGHPEGYTATDILSRYMRMRGRNVLHPMGWDAFGLPAEQYAVRTGVHPAITTRRAIDTFRRQLKRFGFSYDWSREFATIDPDYYRWTQWVFLRLYHAWYDRDAGGARPIAELVRALERDAYAIDPSGELSPQADKAPNLDAAITGPPVGVRKWHELSQEERRAFLDSQRLAYLDEQTVNWCPRLGTVLANEEVINGKSERGGHPVYRKTLKQWMFRITAYAERLLRDLDGLDWPQSTRSMQSEWIGRSEGAEIDFPLADSDGSIRVYTTRPDTIFGATFMALAPEHPLVDAILAAPPPGADARAIREYVGAARARSEVDRQAEGKDKTGVFSGLFAVNPASEAQVPVWIADYVLMGYGHGAIMAVPGHDERDYQFARTFGLPVREVVRSFQEDFSAGFRDFVARHRFHKTFDLAVWVKPGQIEDSRGFLEEASRPAGAGAPVALVEDAGPDGVYLATRHEFALGNAALRSAQAYKLDQVIDFPGEGVNSEREGLSLEGLATPEAAAAVITWLETNGIGRRKVQYKLRDWLFSRQRYWGEPFPIVYDEQGNHYPVSEQHLPVRLPEMEQYKPPESDDPAPMLAGAPREWLHTTAGEAGVDPRVLPPQTPVRREANTMPNWAGSCWYYLRYCDPHNDARFVGAEAERYWMDGTGVDLYVGGAEHAVLHLLYARFWHKVLFDLGHVSTVEPAKKLFHQGLITSYAFQHENKSLVPADQVWELRYDREGGAVSIRAATGGEAVRSVEATSLPAHVHERLQRDGVCYIAFGPGADLENWRIQDVHVVTRITAKMSKSLKNVVNPDDVIAEYGADTMRLYEMYMGPLEASKPWNPRDITGLFRFCQRAWRVLIDEETGEPRLGEQPDDKIERDLHRAIAKVEADIEKLAFNTAIAALIEFVNAATASGRPLTRAQAERFTLVLAPFIPHIAEEAWARLGHAQSLAMEPWPKYDERRLRDESIEIPVQVGGKVRGRITVPADADSRVIEEAALREPAVRQLIEGKTIRKVVVVPGKMVNIVAG